jgi:hypothetical protein
VRAARGRAPKFFGRFSSSSGLLDLGAAAAAGFLTAAGTGAAALPFPFGGCDASGKGARHAADASAAASTVQGGGAAPGGAKRSRRGGRPACQVQP